MEEGSQETDSKSMSLLIPITSREQAVTTSFNDVELEALDIIRARLKDPDKYAVMIFSIELLEVDAVEQLLQKLYMSIAETTSMEIH